MLNAARKKTASAPKFFLPLLLILLITGAAGGPWLWRTWNCHTYIIADNYTNNRQLHIAGQVVKLELVDKPAQLEQGLSGRSCLPADQGMLFNLGQSGLYPFWMRDMKFPIDIIWANHARQVVNIESNVQPKSYPRTFVNTQPAQYVLEIPAGKAAVLGIKPGTTLTF